MNATPGLSHTFSSESIDEKVFAHVLKRCAKKGRGVPFFPLSQAKDDGGMDFHLLNVRGNNIFC